MVAITGGEGANFAGPPTGARSSAPSFSGSTARSPLTSISTKPVTVRAGSASAVVAASRFASMVPESQKRWR